MSSQRSWTRPLSSAAAVPLPVSARTGTTGDLEHHETLSLGALANLIVLTAATLTHPVEPAR